jgi:hypothetical protein
MSRPAEFAAASGAEGLADLVELELLAGERQSLSQAAIQELLLEAVGASPAASDLAINHLAWRAAAIGTAYPVEVRNVGVFRRAAPDIASPYLAMLILSSPVAPFRAHASELAKASVIFERLVVPATERLLGDGARGVRFAWPSEVGRPQEFPAAVAWLGGLMGIQMGGSYRPPRRQDGGVDIVTWRRFPDGRSGFPILLTQATIQRDPVAKSRDIDTRLWSGYLRFDVDPLTSLALPYVVGDVEAWNEMTTRTIVLDRVRLTTLIGMERSPDAVVEWVGSQLRLLGQEAR